MARRTGRSSEARAARRIRTRAVSFMPQLRQLPRSSRPGRRAGRGRIAPAASELVRARIYAGPAERGAVERRGGNSHAGVARPARREIFPLSRKWCADFTPRRPEPAIPQGRARSWLASLCGPHCAQCHGDKRRRRRIGGRAVPDPAHEFPGPTPEHCRQSSRAPKRSGRNAHGSLDQPVVGSRTFRRGLFRARVLPAEAAVRNEHDWIRRAPWMQLCSSRWRSPLSSRSRGASRPACGPGSSGPSTASRKMCEAMMRGSDGVRRQESAQMIRIRIPPGGQGLGRWRVLCAAIGLITVAATLAWGRRVPSRSANRCASRIGSDRRIWQAPDRADHRSSGAGRRRSQDALYQ